MTDHVYMQILKPMNQCSLTGHECIVKSERIGHFRVVLVKDNWSQYRIIAVDTRSQLSMYDSGAIASGILFDQFKTVRFKYTREQYRGHNLTRQLFALAQLWAKVKFKYDENLTEAGLASIR